jgi:hypothetical protein
MIQICVMPGPVTPKDDGFWTFLDPLFDELKILSSRGMNVVCSDGMQIHSKVRLLICTGDIVGISVLANHAGHMSRFGCRICPVEGRGDENNRGMYFEPTDDNLSLPWRTLESFAVGHNMVKKKKKKRKERNGNRQWTDHFQLFNDIGTENAVAFAGFIWIRCTYGVWNR